MAKRETVAQLSEKLAAYHPDFYAGMISDWLRTHFIDPDTMKQGPVPRYYGPDHWTKEQKDRFQYLYGCKLLEGGCDNEAADEEFAAMWPEFAAGREANEFP